MRYFPDVVDELKLEIRARLLDPDAFTEEAYDPDFEGSWRMQVRRSLAYARAAVVEQEQEQKRAA
jgi:hypothetical protein